MNLRQAIMVWCMPGMSLLAFTLLFQNKQMMQYFSQRGTSLTVTGITIGIVYFIVMCPIAIIIYSLLLFMRKVQPMIFIVTTVAYMVISRGGMAL